MQDQAVSGTILIPANIAEGRRQKSENEFGRFLWYALNSSSELEDQLIVARDTEAIPESDFVSLISQTIIVQKMLYGLVKRLSFVAFPRSAIPERNSIRNGNASR